MSTLRKALVRLVTADTAFRSHPDMSGWRQPKVERYWVDLDIERDAAIDEAVAALAASASEPAPLDVTWADGLPRLLTDIRDRYSKAMQTRGDHSLLNRLDDYIAAALQAEPKP